MDTPASFALISETFETAHAPSCNGAAIRRCHGSPPRTGTGGGTRTDIGVPLPARSELDSRESRRDGSPHIRSKRSCTLPQEGRQRTADRPITIAILSSGAVRVIPTSPQTKQRPSAGESPGDHSTKEATMTRLDRGQIGKGKCIDTTVKSSRGPFRAFAPTWDMVISTNGGTRPTHSILPATGRSLIVSACSLDGARRDKGLPHIPVIVPGSLLPVMWRLSMRSRVFRTGSSTAGPSASIPRRYTL